MWDVTDRRTDGQTEAERTGSKTSDLKAANFSRNIVVDGLPAGRGGPLQHVSVLQFERDD